MHISPDLLAFLLGEGLPVGIEEPDRLFLVSFASLGRGEVSDAVK